MAFLQDAAKWNQRRLEVDPKDSEAYYYFGVIDWTKAFRLSKRRASTRR